MSMIVHERGRSQFVLYVSYIAKALVLHAKTKITPEDPICSLQQVETVVGARSQPWT